MSFEITVDLSNFSIESKFCDEVTRFKTKKGWRTILETLFLLDEKEDFVIESFNDPDKCFYFLKLSFISQVGKYSFFRLTSNPHNPIWKAFQSATPLNRNVTNEVSCEKTDKNFLLKIISYFQKTS